MDYREQTDRCQREGPWQGWSGGMGGLKKMNGCKGYKPSSHKTNKS